LIFSQLIQIKFGIEALADLKDKTFISIDFVSKRRAHLPERLLLKWLYEFLIFVDHSLLIHECNSIILINRRFLKIPVTKMELNGSTVHLCEELALE
jgi:hypothetical protein